MDSVEMLLIALGATCVVVGGFFFIQWVFRSGDQPRLILKIPAVVGKPVDVENRRRLFRHSESAAAGFFGVVAAAAGGAALGFFLLAAIGALIGAGVGAVFAIMLHIDQAKRSARIRGAGVKRTPCRSCGERIPIEAKVCRFCQTQVVQEQPTEGVKQATP